MRQALLAIPLAALSACEGKAGELGPDARSDELSPCTSTVTVGTAPMRRLSHNEYRYSLTDVFAQPTLAAQVVAQVEAFLADTQSLGFRNGAAFLDVKPVLAQQYMDAAEALATAATSDLSKLLPCTSSGDGSACATDFITAFGKALYRRPLTQTEVAGYQKVYADARAQGYDFGTGIQWVVFTFLQSPGFLYRVELDTTGDAPVRPVTPLELASRLSFLLWQSGPDAALLEAAVGGKLETKTDVEREARRLLADLVLGGPSTSSSSGWRWAGSRA